LTFLIERRKNASEILDAPFCKGMRMAQKLKRLLGHFHFEEKYSATQGTTE